jgi:hypothetical protein
VCGRWPSYVAHQGHPVPAGVRHAFDVDDHDRAPQLRRRRIGEATSLGQFVELEVSCRDDAALAVEPKDPRRSLERAQHDHDPPVLSHVGDRLGSAAHEVQIRDGVRVEHPQRLNRSLGRHVHVPVPVERSASDEEHRLLADPPLEPVVYGVKNLPHLLHLTER